MSTISDAEAFLEAFAEMKRAVFRSAWRIFAPLHLGPTQVNLMRELSQRGAIPQADLARAMTSDPAATSRAVLSLERVGWVRRKPSDDDRRALRVEMTAEGKRAMKRIDVAYASLAKALVLGLSPRDVNDLRRIATKVVAREAKSEAPKKRAGRSR